MFQWEMTVRTSVKRGVGYLSAGILLLIAIYSIVYALTTNEFCLSAGNRCISMKRGWVEVKLMSGAKSMILHDRGFFRASVLNDLDILFLDSNEAEHFAKSTSGEPISQYKFGKIVRVRDTTFMAQNFKVPGFFQNAVFVVDHAAVIRCGDLVCLEGVESIR